MSEYITNGGGPAPATAPPLPDWLAGRFLAPGERVVWWCGPRHGPRLEWLMARQTLAACCGWACFYTFPFAGAFLAALLGARPDGGFFFASLAGVAAVCLSCVPSVVADRGTWHVVTDRRSFVVKGQRVRDCDPAPPNWGRPESVFTKPGLFTAAPKDGPPGAFTDSAPPDADTRFAEAPGPHSRDDR